MANFTAQGTGRLEYQIDAVTLTFPANFFTVTASSPTEIRLSAAPDVGQEATILTGSFTGSGSAATIAGTVSGYRSLDPAGQIDVVVSGLALPFGNIFSGSFQIAQLLSGSDIFTGGRFADVVTGLEGSDEFLAGAGVDTWVVRGSRAQYSVTNLSGVLTVTDQQAGRDGIDRLFNTEIVQFIGDQRVIAALPAAEAAVARLYSAAFGRLPDAGGLAFWLEQFRAGASKTAIAVGFTQSAEYAGIYNGTSNGQFVDRLYQNILGRPGEPGGASYWNGILTGQQDTRLGVLVNFSDSAENVTRTADWLFVV